MLKTDLRTSEKVASWPREIRYFWVLFWGYLDDHGKGKDNPLLIKADCFPLDPDITGDVIDGWMWTLSDAGVIARYEVDGVNFVQAVNWAEHQKPQHPTDDVLPSYDSDRASLRNSSCIVHEERTPSLGLGLVKSGFESGIGCTPAELAALAIQAYELWPKKVNRARAVEKFKTAATKVGAHELLSSVHVFADAYRSTTEKQFIPGLDVWLNGERWTDELPTRPEPKRGKEDAFFDVLRMGQELMTLEVEA
jgi:hypothetical protein